MTIHENRLSNEGLMAWLGGEGAVHGCGIWYRFPSGCPSDGWLMEIHPASGLLVTTTYLLIAKAITQIYTLPQHCLCLFSIDGGEITIHENGKKVRHLRQGIHLIMHKGQAVKVTLQPVQRLIYTSIAVSNEFLAAYLKDHPLEQPFAASDASAWENRHYDAPDIQLVFEQLKAAVRNGKLSPMYFESKIVEILALVQRNVHDEYSWKRHQKSERKYYVTYQNYKYLELVRAELDKNILQPPSIDQLALIAEMSVTKLYRCFKEQYKITINDYIRRGKMKYAMRMLWNDAMSIKNIATKIGYENASKFSAAFKRVHGFSPRHFRKSFGL